MDTLIDNFGKDFKVQLGEGNDIIVDLKCNPDAFFYWVMQYGQLTEVLEPESMRERIKKASYLGYKDTCRFLEPLHID